MSREKTPAFTDLGGDVDESMSALRSLLLDRLGDEKAVNRWFDSNNYDLLEGKTPEVVFRIDPDKVVKAAFLARRQH